MPLIPVISTLKGVGSIVRCDYELFVDAPAVPTFPATNIMIKIDGVETDSGAIANAAAMDAFFVAKGFTKFDDYHFQWIDSEQNIAPAIAFEYAGDDTIYYYVSSYCWIINAPYAQEAVTAIWDKISDSFIIGNDSKEAVITRLALGLIETALTSPVVDQVLTDEQKTVLANKAKTWNV